MIPNEPEVVYNVRQRHTLVVEQTLGKLNLSEQEVNKGEKTFFGVLHTVDKKGKEAERKEIKREK